jgi:hypothetical protein
MLEADTLRAGDAGHAEAEKEEVGGGAILPFVAGWADGARGIEDAADDVGAVGVALGVDIVELLAFETDIGVGVNRAAAGMW